MYFDLGRYEEAREALRHHPQPTEDADYFENLDRILDGAGRRRTRPAADQP